MVNYKVLLRIIDYTICQMLLTKLDFCESYDTRARFFETQCRPILIEFICRRVRVMWSRCHDAGFPV